MSGCTGGDAIERVPMSGKVTYQGQPVEDGQITFKPQSKTSAPITIEKIENGMYETRMSGGVPVGSHRIEILAFDPTSVRNPREGGPGGPPRKQLLPVQYNSRSELEITLKPGQEALVKDFDL